MNALPISHRGNSEVNFFINEKDQLRVTIDTERLHLRSVTSSDEDCISYAALFGDKEVMCRYATGETKTAEEIESRIKNVWVKRWHQNDPYAGLVVCKNDTDEFVGSVAMGYGDAPGESELGYLFMKKYWGKGFGTEAVTAVVTEYAPETIARGYKLEGKALEKITATARPDNPASVRILEKLGMHKTGEEVKYGALRTHYAFDLNGLLPK
jgi:ribosomal-protein-alanine N-acetyltransferase